MYAVHIVPENQYLHNGLWVVGLDSINGCPSCPLEAPGEIGTAGFYAGGVENEA